MALNDNTAEQADSSRARTKGDQAVYRQVERDLRRRLDSGHWTPGNMLPSRRDLAKHYSVSTLTVERAVTCLVEDGLLRADDRRGTFVAAARSAAGEQEIAHSTVEPRSRKPKELNIGIIGSLFLLRHDHLELNNHWVRLLLHSIEKACAQDGNYARFFNRSAGYSAAAPLADTVAEAYASGVDAVVVIGIGATGQEIEQTTAVIDRLRDPRPLVIISSDSPPERPVAHVGYDDYGAGYEAERHMLDNGCRRQLVFAPISASWASKRLAGIRSAFQHAKQAESTIVVLPNSLETWRNDVDPTELAYRSAVELLGQVEAPVGVICLQDQAAFGFMKASEEAGLVGGRDYAIMGFDDHPDSSILRLSSMRPPIEDMGAEAARMLRKCLLGEQASYHMNLRWRLVARDSTITRRSEAPQANAT